MIISVSTLGLQTCIERCEQVRGINSLQFSSPINILKISYIIKIILYIENHSLSNRGIERLMFFQLKYKITKIVVDFRIGKYLISSYI